MPPHNDIDDLVGLTVLCSSAKRHINEPECLEPQNVASPGSLLSDVGIPRVASSFYCPLTMALMKDPVQDREGITNMLSQSIFLWLHTNTRFSLMIFQSFIFSLSPPLMAANQATAMKEKLSYDGLKQTVQAL